jgi:transcriptional regulator with XRE-family HTH domain
MTPTLFREIRQRLGLNQAQLATMLAFGSHSRISEIEHGKLPIHPRVAELMRAYSEGYRPHNWPTDEVQP